MTTSNAQLTANLSAQDRELLDVVYTLNNLIGPETTTTTTNNNNSTTTVGTINGGATLSSLDTAQLCQQYQSIRPTLEKFLPYISLIPIVGSAAAAVIRTLMGILDAFCGTSS